MARQIECILDARADLGEGPVWDHRAACLWWVNITQGEVHCFDPASGADRTVSVGQMVGAAVPREAGGLVLAMHHGFALLDPEKETLSPLADPEPEGVATRFNDGKCDPAGRFWAGTMPLDDAGPVGSLYCLEADGTAIHKRGGVTCSNGLAWTSDNRTFYYIDTPTRCVTAYDYDRDTGDIRNPRTVITIPDAHGYPDGMTIDAEDKLWVAHWADGCIGRYDPESGEFLERIEVPAANVTSCAFGHEDYRRLYITTARVGQSASALEAQPLAGGIFAIDTDVPGMPACFFAG